MIRDRIKDFRRMPARDLLANPKNWRRHPKAQEDALRGVLAEIGYADALIARETPDGLMLIDGHLRAETTPDATVPVLVLDVSEEEADKLLLTLDPLAAMAEADRDRLAGLLASVEASNDAVAAMLEALAREAKLPLPVNEGLTDPDAIPEAPEPITRPGDLWLLGDHRLLCGDSTKVEDIERLMAGEIARLIVSDPPYGVQYSSPGKRNELGHLSYADSGRRNQPLINDDLGDDTPDFWRRGLESWPLNGDAYLFSPSGPLMVRLALAIGQAGIEHHQWLIWVKSRLVPGRGHYHYRHEHIFYGWKGQSFYNGSRTEDSVWEADKPPKSEDHPTMKPVALIERAIGNSSQAGDIITDPFLGSGTTVIAAERLGRRCYAMEIEARYVDVAVRRWEDYTGRKAEREGISVSQKVAKEA